MEKYNKSFRLFGESGAGLEVIHIVIIVYNFNKDYNYINDVGHF